VSEQFGGESYILLCGGEDEVQSPFNRGKEIVVRQEDLEADPGSYQLNEAFRGDDPFSIDEVKRLLEKAGITSLKPGERRLVKNISAGVRGKVDFSGSTKLTMEAGGKGQLGEMIEETERYMDRLVRMGEVLGIRFEQHTSDSFIFWALPEDELGLKAGEDDAGLSLEEKTLVFGWLAEKLYQEMSASGNWLSQLSPKVIAQKLNNIPFIISLGQQGELYVDVGGSNFNFASPMEKAAKRGFPAGPFGRKEITDKDKISRSETLQKEHFVVDRSIADAADLSAAKDILSEREVHVSGKKLAVTAVNPGREEFEKVALSLLAKNEKLREQILRILAEKEPD